MLRSEMESQRARQELTTVQQQLTQTVRAKIKFLIWWLMIFYFWIQEEQLQLSEREKLTLQRENITTQIQLREKVCIIKQLQQEYQQLLVLFTEGDAVKLQ